MGFAQESGTHFGFNDLVFGKIIGLGEPNAELARQRHGQVALGDHAELGQHALEPFAAFDAKTARALQ